MSDIKRLLEQYLDESISEADFRRLWASLNEADKDGEWHAVIESLLNNRELHELTDKPQGDVILNRIHTAFLHSGDKMEEEHHKAESAAPPVQPVHFLYRWGWVAAVVLVCAATFFFLNRHPAEEMVQNNIIDRPPGGNIAMLRLADGSVIKLDSASAGTLAVEGDVPIKKTADGEITYTPQVLSAGERLYNTLHTPRGGQYRLRLPDGSRVWLNAASSIRFPNMFTGEERTVELTGEAYFEIEGNPEKPFRVLVKNKMEVAVLGTHFNINAYDNEMHINTTLLSGRIKVSAAGKPGQGLPGNVVLQPGQQARLATDSNTGVQLIRTVDIQKTVAWKNGLFNFDDAPLSEVLRQLERWYDIRVVYEPPAEEVTFKGKIYRNIHLSDALKVLKIMKVNFELKGNTLYVR